VATEQPRPEPAGALPRIVPAGDQAYLIRFGDGISEALHTRVITALASLDRSRPPWVVDLVPSYSALLLNYDPALASPEAVVSWIENRMAEAGDSALETRRVTIPVWYAPEVGLDLLALASELTMSPDEIVALHSRSDYLVFMLGFKPGFPYMGTLPERLVVPRLASPRTAVPAGSVAIAGRQTGIYSVRSPGGWRILGRTPLALFDPDREEPFLLRAGDRVRFEPIDRTGFLELEEQCQRGGPVG
jgi:inhibitor of KinA